MNFGPTTLKRRYVGFKQILLLLLKLHAGMVIADVDENFVKLHELLRLQDFCDIVHMFFSSKSPAWYQY